MTDFSNKCWLNSTTVLHNCVRTASEAGQTAHHSRCSPKGAHKKKAIRGRKVSPVQHQAGSAVPTPSLFHPTCSASRTDCPAAPQACCIAHDEHQAALNLAAKQHRSSMFCSASPVAANQTSPQQEDSGTWESKGLLWEQTPPHTLQHNPMHATHAPRAHKL